MLKDSSLHERILILPPSPAIGDIVSFAASFEAVRKAHPKAEITVAYRGPPVQGVVEAIWQPDKVCRLPKFGPWHKFFTPDNAFGFLWQGRFSTIYEFGTARTTRRYLILARLIALLQLRRCTTIGYQPFARYGTRHGYLTDERAYYHGARILRGVGLTPNKIDISHLLVPIPAELQQTIGDKPYVVFASEANSSATGKAWSAAGFAEVAGLLQTEGYLVLATGSATHKESISKIAADNPQVINLAGKTTLAELYTLIQGAAACLSLDTGGGHLAEAACTPLLSLFSDQGHESPRRWAAPSAKVLLTRGSMAKHLPAPIVAKTLLSLIKEQEIDDSDFPPRVCLWSAERDQSENRKKVLLLFRNGLGEVVVAWQMFQALLHHHQNNEIHCIADKSLQNFLEQAAEYFGCRNFSVHIAGREHDASFVSLFREARKIPKKIIRKTGIGKWDSIYDLSRNRWSRAVCLGLRLSPKNRRVALYGEKPWAKIGLPKHEGRTEQGLRHHATYPHIRLAKFLDLKIQEPDFAFLEQELSSELKAAIGDKPFALLIVGSSGGITCRRRWAVEGWAELAGKLAREGIQPVLIGTAVDSDTARQVAAKAPYAVNLVSQTNFAQLYSLAAQASCIVSGDTGAGHLAGTAAARHKVPMLSLFGEATDPERWLPPSALAIQHKPLRQLKADAVWQKLHPLLPVRHK